MTDLEQALYGGTLAEAAGRLEGTSAMADIHPVSGSMLPIGNAEIPRFVPTASNPLALPYILTADEIQQCQRYALRILQDHEYVERVAKARQWQEKTLHDLALDGYLGRDEEGTFASSVLPGCKSRWKKNSERRFRFLFGRSWLWRRS